MIRGHPALRLLLRRKFRGSLRRQVRKLKTLRGIVFSLLGLGLLGLWVASLLLPSFSGHAHRLDSAMSAPLVSLGLLVLTVLSLSGALVHRGLFVPREEIERLFSSPIARIDLIRYRLWVNVGRGLFGAVVIGLLVSRRMPRPLLAFVGMVVALETIPILNQLFAILAGILEKRIASRLARIRTLVVVVAVALMVPFMVWLASDRDPSDFGGLGRFRGLGSGQLLNSPLVAALTLPMRPWVRMIAAESTGDFLAWCAVCAGIWFLLFEGTVRLPVDFREISLDTSAHVAARLRRARRGGGVASGKVTRRAVGWRIPWIFGRGPLGAIAWRKTGSILRKAKGTLLVSLLVVAFVTVLASVLDIGSEDAGQISAPLFIAAVGTIYLCAGLRFDFRDELDRMEVIRAWPISPRRLFAAMLLPEVLLVSCLLVLAVVGRAILLDQMNPLVLAIGLVLPLVVFAWVALDNAAYLFAPVRFVPGQEGMLQNVGRGMIMMLVRLVLLLLVLVVAGFPAGLVFYLARESLGASPTTAILLSTTIVWVALLGVDLALVGLGGWTLSRFDVARDRG